MQGGQCDPDSRWLGVPELLWLPVVGLCSRLTQTTSETAAGNYGRFLCSEKAPGKALVWVKCVDTVAVITVFFFSSLIFFFSLCFYANHRGGLASRLAALFLDLLL